MSRRCHSHQCWIYGYKIYGGVLYRFSEEPNLSKGQTDSIFFFSIAKIHKWQICLTGFTIVYMQHGAGKTQTPKWKKKTLGRTAEEGSVSWDGQIRFNHHQVMDDVYSHMSAFYRWLSRWCPVLNVGFIAHWKMASAHLWMEQNLTQFLGPNPWPRVQASRVAVLHTSLHFHQ